MIYLFPSDNLPSCFNLQEYMEEVTLSSIKVTSFTILVPLPCRSTGATKGPNDRVAKDFVATLIGLETVGPYSKNFVQSKSSQYRKMKQEWRQNVVLAR
jgi:hypothetical protein